MTQPTRMKEPVEDAALLTTKEERKLLALICARKSVPCGDYRLTRRMWHLGLLVADGCPAPYSQFYYALPWIIRPTTFGRQVLEWLVRRELAPDLRPAGAPAT